MHEVDSDGCAEEPRHTPVAGKARPVAPAGARSPGRPPLRAASAELPAFAHQPDLVLTAQEQERQRIAVDLHDGLGPLLTLIRLELRQAAELIEPGSAAELALAPAIERASAHVARAFDELRRTVINLRPAMLDDLGIVPTLGWLIREFELSRAGVQIRVDLDVAESEVPADLKIVIFRICQEGLNNIVRHSAAGTALLSLTRSARALQLCIEDDGCGLPLAAADLSDRAGGGLAGIYWRAASSGGQCEIVSEPGGGTRLRVVWPLAAREGQR